MPCKLMCVSPVEMQIEVYVRGPALFYTWVGSNANVLSKEKSKGTVIL